MKTAKAFSPSGISSFFEICDTTPEGKPIFDKEKVGARGGGFGIAKGTTTEVAVSESEANEIRVFINGVETVAQTTRAVVQLLLERAEGAHQVQVNHTVEVPIGAGFGTSAAGALNTALALSRTLSLNLTFNQLGKIAHVAEVECKTGLGTVGPLMLGGCILTIEPGSPGVSIIDRIPLSSDFALVAGVYGSISTREVLTSSRKRHDVNLYGKKTLERILLKPSPENFLGSCLDFAQKAGFMTNRLQILVRLAKKAGAIGSAQNMVGEAVHALTTSENKERVAQAFRQVLPKEKVIVANVDLQGARLIG